MFDVMFEEQDLVFSLFVADVSEHFDQMAVGVPRFPRPPIASNDQPFSDEFFRLARFDSNFRNLLLRREEQNSRTPAVRSLYNTAVVAPRTFYNPNDLASWNGFGLRIYTEF